MLGRRDPEELPARLPWRSRRRGVRAVGRKAGDVACPTLGAGGSRWWDPGDRAQARHKPTAAAANAPGEPESWRGLCRNQEGSRQAEPGRGQPQLRRDGRKRCAFGRGFHAQTGARESARGTGPEGLSPASRTPQCCHAVGYGDKQGRMGLLMVHICPGSTPAPAERPSLPLPSLLLTAHVDSSTSGEVKESDPPLDPAASTEEPGEVQEGDEMPGVGKGLGEFTLPGFPDPARPQPAERGAALGRRGRAPPGREEGHGNITRRD